MSIPARFHWKPTGTDSIGSITSAKRYKRTNKVYGPRKSLITRLVLAMGIVAMVALAMPFAQASGKNNWKIESELNAKKASKGGLPVIIQFADDSTQADQDSIIRGHGIKNRNNYRGLAAVSADVDSAALDSLADNPKVLHVSYDHEVRSNFSDTVQTIGADQVWFNGAQSQFTGKGITVAVIDSGIASNPDLNNVLQTQVAFGPKSAVDEYGHGTHVAGIITGDGLISSNSKFYSATYRGVAPDASVLNLRVLDANGSGQTSDVMAALQWCLDNMKRYNIRVINLSLGHPVYESYKDDPLCRMVERCVAAGMVVVTAAGNYGKDDKGSPVYGGITSPGNDPVVITVGAVNQHDTPMRSDDTMATYSSRGPTAIDGLIKPDLVAPGDKIVSTANKKTTLYQDYPNNQVTLTKSNGQTSNYYMMLSGTSMAAPAVSGTVALMLQANPSLTPNAVKAILSYTAGRMTHSNILEQGNGYLNAEGAVRMASAVRIGETSCLYHRDLFEPSAYSF